MIVTVCAVVSALPLTGEKVGAGGLTSKVTPADVPPAPVTVTETALGLAIRLAGTAAVSCEVFTYVVVNTVLSQLTVAVASKFVPLTVRVKAAPPIVAEVGEMPVIVGAPAILIVNVEPADVPPDPVTVIVAEPEVAIRLAGTAAVSWVALIKVVGSAVAPHLMVEVELKFVPLTVSVKAALPAEIDTGDRLVIVGTAALIVKVAPDDVPPEVLTVTVAVPEVVIRLAGTAAVSCVALR